MIRTSGDARALLDELQRVVQEVDPLMAATDSQTIEEYMALPLFPARATGLLLGASGILAVVLTAIGLFGVSPMWFRSVPTRSEYAWLSAHARQTC